MTTDEVRLRRRTSFDDDADAYHAGRPDYPVRVYEVLVERCGLGPARRVLEIGAGTGQATRLLLDHGAEVVAIELGARLAARLRRQLAGPRLSVVEGDFATVPVPDGVFDLVVSATAFHWLDPAVAVPKAARVLRPDGWLAVWWTVFGDPRTPAPWRAGLDDLYDRFLPHERRAPGALPGPLRVPEWTADLTAGGWFGPVHTELIPWRHELSASAARALFATFPNLRELPVAQRREFLDAVADLVERAGGTVTDHYVTALYLARRAR